MFSKVKMLLNYCKNLVKNEGICQKAFKMFHFNSNLTSKLKLDHVGTWACQNKDVFLIFWSTISRNDVVTNPSMATTLASNCSSPTMTFSVTPATTAFLAAVQVMEPLRHRWQFFLALLLYFANITKGAKKFTKLPDFIVLNPLPDDVDDDRPPHV